MEYKFKKGDRVMLLPGNEDYPDAKAGDRGTIEQDHSTVPNIKWDHLNRSACAKQDRLELIPQEPTKEQILSVLEKHPEAEQALKELYPDVVKDNKVRLSRAIIKDELTGLYVMDVHADKVYISPPFIPHLEKDGALHVLTFTRK